jgi:homoserine kinase
VRLGVLTGLNALAGSPLSRQGLFEMCAELEGHPDNAAPAQFGGFTVASADRGAPMLRFPVAGKLRFVLLVPDFEVRTDDARRLLPATVSRLDAVVSSARACRITAAFAAHRYDALTGSFADTAFHQPHRQSLVPFLPAVLTAAITAGALGGFLSGSGSTIACLTLHDPERVAAAMRAAAGLAVCRTIITRADNLGARIVASASA